VTTESMTSAACLVNRPDKCRGVISLAYVGPCAGPAHDPAPIEDEEPEPDDTRDDAWTAWAVV
jgi:hypothetical protein